MTDTTPSTETKSFADFGVADDIAAALTEAGITSPFPIQELTLPLGLGGADVIGQARTGTGKTLAFGIPLLQRISDAHQRTQALVIVPTRELCLQVAEDLQRASARRSTRVIPVYGGKAIDAQSSAIAKGAPVVVGTPGRLLDLMRRRLLDLSGVTALVLDEADEMLDLGFLPDVEALIEACATDRQTLLFSATMPAAVVALARRYMRKPTFLRAEVEEARIAPETEQHFFSCHRMDKPAVLARVLQTPERGLCVVFTRTKRMADVLASELRDRGIDAAPIHSDLRQDARERAMSRFRQGKIDVLVATEVAARGLDISDVTHVVNYDCPDDEKMYLHRIGRTGRAGERGVAVTLALWNELARLEMIKKALDIEAPTHEVFSTSPILDELFALPPRAARRPSAPPATTKAKSAERGRRPQRASRSPQHATTGRGPATTSARADGTAPSAETAPAETAPAETAPAETAPAEDKTEVAGTAPAPQEAPARRSRATRPVTRTRRRSAGGDATGPTTTPKTDQTAPPAARTDDSPAPTAVGAPEPDGRPRRRVRTRARGRAAGAAAPERPARRPAGAQSTKPRPRPSRDPAPAEPRRRERDAGPERDGAADAERTRRARPRKPRSTQPASATGDIAATRGSGKPALNRPMTMTHLP